VLTDQLIWRPIIDWSDKFKFENVETADRVKSPVLAALRQSNVLGAIHQRTFAPLGEQLYRSIARRRLRKQDVVEPKGENKSATLITIFLVLVLGALICFAAFRAILLLRQVPRSEFGTLLEGAGMTRQFVPEVERFSRTSG